jgi:pyruvate dehydrogenase E2 component (dihydrolipoamide acetyltransferase)
MATEFKLPELGENIDSGDLVRLLISAGSSIAEGQPVMELETDKAVIEVPSSVSGTVGEVRVKEGDKLRVGQVIFTVENGAKPAGAQKTQAPPAPAKIGPSTPANPEPVVVPRMEASASAGTSSASGASEFRLQELGENISSGDLVRLLIAPGARVSEGQPVIELETDKAVVEVPSNVSGVVREVKVKEGEKVKVGQVIFTLEGGAVAPVAPPKKHEPVEHVSGQHAARLAFQMAMKAEGKTEEQALPPDQTVAQPSTFTMPVQLGKVAGTEHRDPVPAAPSVRRLAREIGVDIHAVLGSGPGGRISDDDVKCRRRTAAAAAVAAQTRSWLRRARGSTFPGGRSSAFPCVSPAQDCRASSAGLNTIPHVTQQDVPTSPNWNSCEQDSLRSGEAGGKWRLRRSR